MTPHPSTSSLDRLAAARPAVPPSLLGPDERDELLDTIVRTGALSTARRTMTRLPVVAVALAVVVVVAVIGVMAVGTTRPRPGDTIRTTAAAPQRPAPTVVLDRVRLAMAATDASVVRVDTDYDNGVLWRSWYDGQHVRSLSTTPEGEPIYDHEMTVVDGTLQVLVVSYRDRAWWTYSAAAERGELADNGAPSPDEVRAKLDDGTLREVGRETVDGREEIHLRSLADDQGAKVIGPTDLWVDAATYLPHRLESGQAGGRKHVRSTFTWLARTDATLADLTAPVPPGFPQLPGAPEPG
jgi:hypothetical protein